MKVFDFDSILDRKSFYSAKWCKYGDRDVLPFWVADMDFPVPSFLVAAVSKRLEHASLGYSNPPDSVTEAFVGWCAKRLRWIVDPDWLVWIHGVVPGLNLAVRSVGVTNDQILIPIPVYPPFLKLAGNNYRRMQQSSLVLTAGQWLMDFEDLRDKASACSALVVCNPQNPTGRIYTETELRQLAALCLDTNTVLVSDEIHWGLTLDSKQPHLPVASLDPEFANNTITLISHTKAYNIPGLQVGMAVIPNEKLRTAFIETQERLYGSISPLSFAAAEAAYRDESTWLSELNAYLSQNRELLQEAIDSTTNLSMTHVEGTCLGWIDASNIPVKDPAAYFEAFGLGLSPGKDFGSTNMVRFNFGTSKQVLQQGIERLLQASSCAF